MNKLTISSSCGGVGDNLVYTSIFDVADVIFEMKEHPKSRNVAQLFDDMCEVVFVDNPTIGCPENTSRSHHVVQKKLDGLNLAHLTNAIPRINYMRFYSEYLWNATQTLNKYRSPIAFVYDNNGTDMPAKYRIPPKQDMQNYINHLHSQEHDILQFGLSNRITEFDNTVPMLDFSLPKLAVYYSLIRRYVGVDTGDYHLMLAVGGEAEVFVPPSNMWYSHDEWHYVPELWGNEKVRVKYRGFEDLKV